MITFPEKFAFWLAIILMILFFVLPQCSRGEEDFRWNVMGQNQNDRRLIIKSSPYLKLYQLGKDRDTLSIVFDTTADFYWIGKHTFLNVYARNFNATAYACYFPGADMGDRINNAIASLPTRGGVVEMCNDSFGFPTTIDFADRQNIILRGQGFWGRNPSPNNNTGGTILHYTGSGSAIKIGAPGSPFTQGIGLEKFKLISDGDRAIDIADTNSWGWIRDVALWGGGDKTDTGIYLGRLSFAWKFDNLHIENFWVGAYSEGGNHAITFEHCTFLRNVFGTRLNKDLDATAQFFLNCDVEVNDSVGLDFLRGTQIVIQNCYMEGMDSSYSRVIRVGVQNRIDGLVIDNNYIKGGTNTFYGIELIRVESAKITNNRGRNLNTLIQDVTTGDNGHRIQVWGNQLQTVTTELAGRYGVTLYRPYNYSDTTLMVDQVKIDSVLTLGQYMSLPNVEPSTVPTPPSGYVYLFAYQDSSWQKNSLGQYTNLAAGGHGLAESCPTLLAGNGLRKVSATGTTWIAGNGLRKGGSTGGCAIIAGSGLRKGS